MNDYKAVVRELDKAMRVDRDIWLNFKSPSFSTGFSFVKSIEFMGSLAISGSTSAKSALLHWANDFHKNTYNAFWASKKRKTGLFEALFKARMIDELEACGEKSVWDCTCKFKLYVDNIRKKQGRVKAVTNIFG